MSRTIHYRGIADRPLTAKERSQLARHAAKWSRRLDSGSEPYGWTERLGGTVLEGFTKVAFSEDPDRDALTVEAAVAELAKLLPRFSFSTVDDEPRSDRPAGPEGRPRRGEREDTALASVLRKELPALGFKRRKGVWARENPEVLELTSPQKGQGATYWNYGCFLRPLGPDPVDVYKCHVVMRAEDFAACSDSEVRSLLGVAGSDPPPARMQRLQELVRRDFASFAENCRSSLGLARLLKAGRLNRAAVYLVARDYLEKVNG